ncbi:Long-chain-fatty-acid--CoA ligase [bacterium HR40]|nr:Long-chain-fatty-acid--CoA ligase [bacterium HR40]
MPDGSFFVSVARTLTRLASKTAIEDVDRGRSFSFGDLDRQSARLAHVLVRAGASKGDRVAVQVEKSVEALCLYLACLRAGLVFLPLNPAYRAGEVAHMLGNAEPSVFVCDPARTAELAEAVEKAGVRIVLTLGAAGEGTLMEAAAAAPESFATVAVGPDDYAAMLYTSGTTGRPKGAPLSHANLASNATVLVEAWGFTEADVLLHALPIYHAHGLFVAANCALLSGATMLWLARFDRAKVMALLPRATVMMGVPTFYVRLLDDPSFGREQTRNVRLFISGSAPLAVEVWKAFRERTGHAILERYGMSEILMHTGNPLHGERRPGSVGRPFPGCEVKIVDESDRELPPLEVGQVLVRGPNVFRGYWRMPERHAEDFTADGWFRTGDMGYLSEDGYLYLVGRAKDLVITGGLNVYPAEVENALDALPGIRESAVIGLPHPDYGEAVTAVVVPEPGAVIDEGQVIAALKERLAGFKVPKRVIVVDELPRNSMGKVQKRDLRERYARLYDNAAEPTAQRRSA